MIKDLLKASIIGASIIVSTIIYSERNKYEFTDTTVGNYAVLNKRTGEVQSFKLGVGANILGTYYTDVFERYTTRIDSDEAVLIKSRSTVIENLDEDSDE